MQQIFTTDQLWLSGTPSEMRGFFAMLSHEQLHLPLKYLLASMLH